MKNIIKPELVAPAGDWPSLIAAVASGADSVYFGIKNINMRHFAANFDMLELKKVMTFLRKNNRKGYLALNVLIHEEELKKVDNILNLAKKAKVDSIILWDMAALALANQKGLNIHLSTQASVANSEALAQVTQLGVKRVVLARECSLEEIKEIISTLRRKHIKCEIETFIHGAMCVSISGRCFLSLLSHGQSANQGKCLQPCRREYLIKDLTGSESEYIIGEDYILSPKDLCTIDFIDDLIEAKIDAFKIEGRMRSAEYIKVVTSAYRRAIDAYFENKLTAELKKQLRNQVSNVYNRGFSNGFYFEIPQDTSEGKLGHNYQKIYLGEVTRFFKKINVAEINLKHAAITKGQELLFIGKTTPASSTKAHELQVKNNFVESAQKGMSVGIKLPFIVRPKDKVFLWQRK